MKLMEIHTVLTNNRIWKIRLGDVAIITNNLSTDPSTKSLVPNIDIRSATRWLWEIIFNAWKLY